MIRFQNVNFFDTESLLDDEERGIRDTIDLHAELEIATTNRIIGDIETVFLMTDRQHILTSSALIKQIVEIGDYDADHMSRLVPLDVAKRLKQRLRRPKEE